MLKLSVKSLRSQNFLHVINDFIKGLAVGDVKPEFDVFLEPIVNELLHLENGKSFSIQNEQHILRSYLLFAIFDKPARACVNNTTLSTGKYGCLKCMQKGTRLNNLYYNKLLGVKNSY